MTQEQHSSPTWFDGFGGDISMTQEQHSSPTWVDSFHDHLNSINPYIQFTIEKESDGQLPFLDILLNREEDGSISTSVYRKATHTDQYLSFHSHHPAVHKRAVVRTLMCRTEALFSSGVSRAQEEKLVSQALQGNGYPKGLIHKHTCSQPD